MHGEREKIRQGQREPGLGAKWELVERSRGQGGKQIQRTDVNSTGSTFSGFREETLASMNHIYAALIPKLRCETWPRQLPTLEGLAAKIGLTMELGVCCVRYGRLG